MLAGPARKGGGWLSWSSSWNTTTGGLIRVLVDWLVSQQRRGLPIVLLSDMYLPASLLQRFFSAKAPQLLLHRIYVSGEYRASKQDGGLYQRLRPGPVAACIDFAHWGRQNYRPADG